LPTPKRPSKPLAVSSVHRLLTNPYYKGDVIYRGTRYKGTHPALVPPEVWYQVQSVLTAHKTAAEATQVHDHYLKGTIHCGQCGSRLIVSNAKNRHGNVYCYFVCSGHRDAHSSILRHEFNRLIAAKTTALDTLFKIIDRIEQEQDRLMQSHFTDAIPLPVLKRV